MASLASPLQLHRFFVVSWLLAILQLVIMQETSQYKGLALAGWSIVANVTYAVIYLIPAMLIVHGLARIMRRSSGPTSSSAARLTLGVTAVSASSLTHLLLFADRLIYGMYGFHINGFVVNLVFTPGGIASLGASRSTEITAALIAAGLIAVHAAAYAWCTRNATHAAREKPLRWGWTALAFLALTAGERVAYGYSEMTNFQPILFASAHYPLYQPLTYRKMAQRWGFKVSEDTGTNAHVSQQALSYPLKPLQVEPPAKPLNIVWLVAESLRFDMLTSKVMPNTWALSNDAMRLEKHFSGGNMTQMGVFSMFYGLYGNYWFPMLAAQRAPVLMEVLQQQHYQFSLNTSQRFTYPAFDKTIFSTMRAKDMHAREGGAPPWKRDVENIDDLIRFIDQRDPKRPFMTYMFFESTHANYDYPPGTAIASPVLEDFNYITADFASQIGQIKNRYINAAHHVDGQIGRLVEHLRATGLLDQTVVIVLGDHGEEFMEVSRWGHSAEFNRFQTSTPGVIRVPGQRPGVIKGISSHLDIPATLMPLLGVQNPAEDYSLGHNLLAPDFHRDYAVAADWNRIAYIGEHYKMTIPINAAGAVRNEVTDGDDHPIADSRDAVQSLRSAMVEIMGNLARFSRPKG